MYYITHIRLKNIRGFRKLNLDISNERMAARMQTLILGRNGTCKTTLLRCIALGLCDRADGNALIAEPVGRFIAEDVGEATIQIKLSSETGDEKPYEVITPLKAEHDKEVVDDQKLCDASPHKDLFVCGYGAGRGPLGTDRFRKYRIIDSVYTLFRYDESLIDTELTLRRLQDYLGKKSYERTMKGIKKALSLTPRDQIHLPKGGGVQISGPSIGKKIPLEGWADGYRLTFSWIMDLYAWAMRANNVTPTGGIKGVLLIDELEQHIHPSMQTEILPRLTQLLPEIQIFATTHSPLVALGTSPQNVVALRRKGKYVHAEEVIPDFRGYSAEDVLVDTRLFDTAAYSPQTNKKLNRYQKLIKIPKNNRTMAQRKQLVVLTSELSSQQLPEVRESPLSEELRKFREKYDL